MTYMYMYLLLINLFALGVMYKDKKSARHGQRRTPEANIFLYALLGGAFGVLLGMKIFRHKTKHATFKIGIPMILALNIIVFYFLSQFTFNIFF